MKIPAGLIEEIASQDSSRPALNCVYLREGWLEATDSYCFVRVSVESQRTDVDGPIPLSVFDVARKLDETHMELGEEEIVLPQSQARFARPKIEGKPPPTLEELAGAHLGWGVSLATVSLDARLLYEVSRVWSPRLMHRTGVRISYFAPDKALLVTPYDRGKDDPSERALLMPLWS